MRVRDLGKCSLVLCISAIWGFSVTALADKFGNGGDVIVCPSATPRAKLLDVYEGEIRGFRIELGDDSLNYKDKARLAIARLFSMDRQKYERYTKWLNEFESESRLLEGVELPDVPDAIPIAIPLGCQLKQIVDQKEPEFAEDRRYTISADLWGLLNESNKAALVLHELIYRDTFTEVTYQTNNGNLSTLPRNGLSSSKVRYFTSYLISDRMATLDRSRYFAMLADFGLLDYWSVNGVGYWSGSVEFFENGAVRSGVLFEPTSLAITNDVSATFMGAWHPDPILSGLLWPSSRTEFYENGHVHIGNIRGQGPFACRNGAEVYFSDATVSRVTFDQLGHVVNWLDWPFDGPTKYCPEEIAN